MFGLLGEFVSIKAPLKEILTTNHHVLVDTAEKKKMLTLLKDKDASKEITNEEVFSKLKNNPLNTNCRIEIIWSEMDFDLISLLQKDELVDRELTMQRPTSIRIVLGTIGK